MSIAETVLDPALADVDGLERVLARLEWTLLDFRRLELPRAQSTDIAGGRVRFHYVVSGSVEVQGAMSPVPLAAGDFLLLPGARAHRIRSLEDATIASGELDLASSAGDPLLAALPEVLVACGFLVREPHMASLIDGLAREFADVRAGTSVMSSRIATIVAAAAVRSWVENGCAPDQWLVTVRDPYIARAIAAMRDDPGSPWTVESLARVARASRSAFAERFHALVGVSPARYLTGIRMEQAKDLLVRDGLNVAETALRLGYGSEAAFSRAFRRHAGSSPATWRREIARASVAGR
jgi:AraC-like DNA-binding protein